MKIQHMLRIPFALYGIVPTSFLVVATLVLASTGIFLMGEWYDENRSEIAALWASSEEGEEDTDYSDASDAFDIDSPDDEIVAVYVAPEAWDIDEARHHERVQIGVKDYNSSSFRAFNVGSFQPHRFCETQVW